jgi:hypothetical protein
VRYEVRSRDNLFDVWDTELGNIVVTFKHQHQAQKRADRLNSNPPSAPGVKRAWHVTRSPLKTLDAMLDEGWEPFGVDGGFVYLKLKKQGGS